MGRLRQAGFTISELLLVVLFIGLVVGVGATAWSKSRGRMQTASAARTTKIFLHRARMQAIYRGVNHFVVLDPDAGRLAIYADTGGSDGEFDTEDELVATTHLTHGVGLSLPDAGSLPSPLGSGTVTAAWSLPVPSGGAWAGNQRGLMVTPRGVFRSAESTPQNISSGTIVLSTPGNDSAAVTLRGTLGAVRSFQYRNGAWSEI